MRFFLLVITTLAVAAGCSRASSKPDPFAGLEAHSDLTALRHLAEVNDGGWYLDFGTPAQSKYTVGDWRSGWVGKGVDGDTTYAHVGMRGRIYFEADRPAPLVARIRLRTHGTQALTPYLNNKQLDSIHLGKGDGFVDYDIEPEPCRSTVRTFRSQLIRFGFAISPSRRRRREHQRMTASSPTFVSGMRSGRRSRCPGSRRFGITCWFLRMAR
jgi:hypothetical protein